MTVLGTGSLDQQDRILTCVSKSVYDPAVVVLAQALWRLTLLPLTYVPFFGRAIVRQALTSKPQDPPLSPSPPLSPPDTYSFQIGQQ